jgi:phenylacetate-coenzyme A ligase PaaK-like adenylate-forming protein
VEFCSFKGTYFMLWAAQLGIQGSVPGRVYPFCMFTTSQMQVLIFHKISGQSGKYTSVKLDPQNQCHESGVALGTFHN